MGRGIKGAARQLQSVFDLGASGSLSDGELLARFLRRESSSEPAFEALVYRHARMGLRVCRDVLGNSHEAQDAAQATFFILARKAGSIRQPEALASWLYGTARRIALRALRQSIRRRRHERRSAEIAQTKPTEPESSANWAELHEELAKLPDRYRDVIILCDLTGLTHEQAAGRLGCPPRTVETRLSRGRERLKGRLIRRGLAPSTALVGVAWGLEAQATPPMAWVASTALAGVTLAKGGGWAAARQVSTVAAEWARTYLKESIMFKLQWIIGSSLILGLVWQQARTQDPAKGKPGRPDPQAAKAPPKKVADEPLPPTYTRKITIKGRAFNSTDKPIAGAQIYVGSRMASYGRLAEVKTDAEGRYEFRDLVLPIKRADTVGGKDHGAFQVYGEAEGLGFAFRSTKNYYPGQSPLFARTEQVLLDPPAAYSADDPIEIDLSFPPPASLHGTVIDDRGQPQPGIKLTVRNCEVGVTWDDNRNWEFDSYIDEPPPESMKTRTTDAQGRYEFTGLPIDCRFRIMVDAKGFPSTSIIAATAEKSEREYQGIPPETGELKLTMPIPMDVPIQMVYADTRLPVAKAFVQAGGDYAISDEQGRVTLHLSRGKYQMENWPPVGTPYLVTGGTLELGEKGPTEPLVYTLRRGADLEVIVTDEATGQGLAGVDLWHPSEYGPRNFFFVKSFEAPRLVRRDSPRTNEQGRVKVLTEPGKQLIGIAIQAYPEGYEVVEKDGQEVECRVGETTTVRFHMRKLP